MGHFGHSKKNCINFLKKKNPVLIDLNQFGNLRHITINYSNA